MKEWLFYKKGDKYSRMELAIYVGFWLLLFSLPILTRLYEVMQGVSVDLQWHRIQDSYNTLFSIFLLFLLNNFVLLPYLFWKQKKGLYYAVLVGLFALLWTLQEPPCIDAPREIGIHRIDTAKDEKNTLDKVYDIPFNTTEFSPLQPHRPKGPIGMFHITNLILELCVIFFNLAIKMYIYSMRRDMQLLSIHNEKIQQELLTLKYQIKPHFLMNTLNNIQSLIETNPTTACRTLQQLSNMMRYMLYDNNTQEVALSKEMEFMRSFIELMKIRYPDTVKISVDFPKENIEKSIPPLLFISSVENAFKYGVDYSRESMISVKLSVEDKWLVFRCANFISRNTTDRKDGNGIGIKNVRRRLDLIYGNKYELDISQADGLYVVDLKLPIA